MTTMNKTFGEPFIHDDHFFAKIALGQGLSNVLGRLFWGVSIDFIEVKVCRCFFFWKYSPFSKIIIDTFLWSQYAGTAVLLLASLVHLGFPLLAFIEAGVDYRKAFYAFIVISCNGLGPGGNVIIPVGVQQIFGSGYFGPIVGLVAFGMVFQNIPIVNLFASYGVIYIFIPGN